MRGVARMKIQSKTFMHKSIEMCGKCNGATVFVKREDKNPFGTFKDRRCAALLETHRAKEEVVFVHITSGNSGYSLGMLAKEEERPAKEDEGKTKRKIHVVNIVPKGLPSAIKKRLESCSIVHEMDLSKGIVSPDEMRAIARKLTGFSGPEENLISVESYGLANGYKNIIREIAEDGVKPDYIFCPVGEGELLTDLAVAAEAVWGEKAPKLVGVTIPQNVIIKGEDVVFLEKPGKSLADKIVNGYSKFKELVLGFVKSGRIELKTVSEGEIAREYKWLNSIGIPVEPSAAVAFCGAQKYDLKPQDTVVIINTGKGVYDQSAVEKRAVRRILKWLKYAAIVAATAAITTIGVMAAHWHFTKYESNKYYSLLSEADNYADKNGDHEADVAESKEACKTISGRKGCEQVLSLGDLYPKEIEFYVHYKRAENMHDNIGGQIMAGLNHKWESGAYSCDVLASWVCESKKFGWQLFFDTSESRFFNWISR
jgi:threonine dehydratase